MLERDLLQKKKQFPFFYYTAAIVSTVFLILFTSQLLAVFHGSSRDHNSSVPDVQVPSEFIVNFTEHIDYENFSHKFDWKWHELLTPNGGFLVKIDERTGTRRIHGISMFHQLHCLGMIREGVQALQENVMIATGSTHQHQAGADSHHGQIMQHWLHCFDYLRQAILCNADATIEPPSVNSRGQDIVNGMGERKCKDWMALWRLSIESGPAD